MALQFTTATVDDFSGGITDYILAAQPHQSGKIENLLITPNKKLESCPGSAIYDSVMYNPTTGNKRICGLFASALQTLLINSEQHIWIPNTTFLELVGPSSNPALSVGAVTDLTAFADWNSHIFVTNTAQSLPIKIYQDGSSVWQTRTAGLPYLASSPSIASTGTGNNYLYAFLYHYTYTVGTVSFQDFGPTTLVSLTNVGAVGTNNPAITSIPVLANGATGNYDTTVITVYIYRTINNGTTYYKCGQVTNGTTTFTDPMTDTTLQLQTLLYTNTGVLDNESPPQAKYITIVNGLAYYGNLKIGSQVYKNRIQQSVQDDPDSCPSSFFLDFIDEVMGLSSYSDNPLVFTRNHVYRLNGVYAQDGTGQVTAEDITKTIGCVSHQSIVQTRYGVFWAGNDGFYWTDGFNYKKISDSINERYKTYVTTETSSGRIYGTYDTKDNKVYWAVQADTSSSDNDSFVVLDLRWGINTASSFTTRVNGSTFAPTAISFYNGQLIRGDRRGYVFKHDALYLTDPTVDTTVAATSWNTTNIKPDYQSIVSNLGFPYVRKWTTKMLLTMTNVSNVSVQIAAINDSSSLSANLKEIRYRGNVVWGDQNLVWGDDVPNWNEFALVENMRMFPAKYLRCSYKQIEITQSYTNIYKSDTLATATVNNAAKTAILTDAAFAWPTDLSDYSISFENDGYVRNYSITARNSATKITFLDPLNTAPTAVEKWVIRGYPKGEFFSIVSYVIYFAPLTSQSYRTYRSEQDSSGGNA